MPYIKQEQRDSLELRLAKDAGELNYVLTTICDHYISHRGVSYAAINEVVGVLECAKLELYRRVAIPYEDKKCLHNGDVYSNAPSFE